MYLLRVCGCVRSHDEEEPGGAAAAYARREEERARERKSHKTKRRKVSTAWDVAPRGFEHISPLQYKAMQGELQARMGHSLLGCSCEFSLCAVLMGQWIVLSNKLIWWEMNLIL